MRVEREVLGNHVTELVERSAFLFLISYQGLSVKQIDQLRGALDESGATCTVFKNTMIRLGLLNNGLTLPDGFELGGDTAVVHGVGDPCPVAKALLGFAKDHDQVQVKGGFVEGGFMAPEETRLLTEMPPKEVLQAQLLGTLQAPMVQLVTVLNALPRDLVSILNNKSAEIVNVLRAYQFKSEQEES